MNYFRGPWQWRTEGGESYWSPPPGFSGLDIRPLAEQTVSGGTPGLGIFVGVGNPGKDYDLLGSGSWNDIKATQRIKDAIPGKYRPKGDDLLGLILDLFTAGSDPDGIDGPKPIMPTMQGRIELHCGGRSHYERFAWGDRYTVKVIDLIRRDFAMTMAAAQRGELKDAEHHRRVLDALCEKYRVEDWKEFVPANLQKDVPGRLKHDTTVTDDFNRTDSTGLGASWSNMVGSGFDVSSNKARGTNATLGGTRSRYDSDLSSADHYGQVDVISFGSGTGNAGACARCAAAADTCYNFIIRSASPRRRLFKNISGTGTVLTSDNTATTSGTLKVSANGSSLKVYLNGSEITGLATTDTAISSNLRGGMQGQHDTIVGARSTSDNFEAADLSAGGILYTQLERGVRGLHRGMYTRWGG